MYLMIKLQTCVEACLKLVFCFVTLKRLILHFVLRIEVNHSTFEKQTVCPQCSFPPDRDTDNPLAVGHDSSGNISSHSSIMDRLQLG